MLFWIIGKDGLRVFDRPSEFPGAQGSGMNMDKVFVPVWSGSRYAVMGIKGKFLGGDVENERLSGRRDVPDIG